MSSTATPAAPGTAPVGGARRSVNYFDAEGIRRRSHIPVPVDKFGQLAATGFRCRKCTEPYWFPLSTKGVPVCEVHEKKMEPLRLRRPPLLPWRSLWDVCETPLRPVWALPGMAGVGLAVDAAHIPALVVAGVAPVVVEGARRGFRRYRLAELAEGGKVDLDDPGHAKKLRDAVDRAARTVGYSTAGGMGWLAAVAALGLDPSTPAGKVAWALALPAWLTPAATWWHHRREAAHTSAYRAEDTVPDGPEPEVDADEVRVLKIWNTVLAVRVGDVLGVAGDGLTPIKATQSGRLAGTKLIKWEKIRGGWKATIVGPPGMYESDTYLQARGKIAGAYSVTKAMVSIVPDGEDENRCALFVQKASVISEPVPWAGPESVNAQTGLAPLVRYVDGTYGMYEMYRPEWGCPHEVFIGTTGAAKSSALEAVFTIDRWAHYTDADGVKKGIIADFLIDPQQGQSFGAFVDDLAAPVASTVDEAMMLVRAFRREMLRRNKYLSRKKWTDERGLQRRGAKWWNPLEDGPMLFLTIDEAHEFLAIREFSALVTAGARMYRKCGMKIRVATHTPLLSDLGSMALRDMLTGGFVWCGRTANALSGPTAFNGRLPADPKTIPEVPGAAYIMSAREKKPMLARTMWEKDYYAYIRDDDGNPIGYPAELPAETLAAFGEEYASWLKFRADDDGDGEWAPDAEKPADPVKADRSDEFLQSMVMWALLSAGGPLDMNGLDGLLRTAEVEAGTLAVRQVLSIFRGRGDLVDGPAGFELAPKVRAAVEKQMAGSWPLDAREFAAAAA